jgi:hypothetical protein
MDQRERDSALRGVRKLPVTIAVFDVRIGGETIVAAVTEALGSAGGWA